MRKWYLLLPLLLFGWHGIALAAAACGVNDGVNIHVHVGHANAADQLPNGQVNDGRDPNQPLKTFKAGLAFLDQDRPHLCIGPGTYRECETLLNRSEPSCIHIHKKVGSAAKPIVIEGWLTAGAARLPVVEGITTHRHNSAALDYTFHLPNNNAWERPPACEFPSDQWANHPEACPHPHEWVSKVALLPQHTSTPNNRIAFSRASFVDGYQGRHTRLLTYSRIEDLRAFNQTFERICELSCKRGDQECSAAAMPTGDDPRPGPFKESYVRINEEIKTCRERRPWTYMGPGVYYDVVSGKVHIRLSPTANNVTGLADFVVLDPTGAVVFGGSANPNLLPLAIAPQATNTIAIAASEHLTLRRLSVRFGGWTLLVKGGSRNITLDRVTIWGSEEALKSENVKALRVSDSVVDGGLPTWSFRTDLKEEYRDYQHPVAGQPPVTENNLAHSTGGILMNHSGLEGAEFVRSEFVNGHDLYLKGLDVDFHHNWINNMNDDVFFINAAAKSRGRIHHNVVQQSLSVVVTFADHASDRWNIYRNVFDLRSPTAGFRPVRPGSDRSAVWRWGFMFKDPQSSGPLYFFQNTVLLRGQPTDVRNARFSPWDPPARFSPHTVVNNFVVAFQPVGGPQLQFAAVLPCASALHLADGNAYMRVGEAIENPFQTINRLDSGVPCVARQFASLQEYRLGAMPPNTPFYPPGYEAKGHLIPGSALTTTFRQVEPLGVPKPSDDFRLRPGVNIHGVDLRTIDADAAALDQASFPDWLTFASNPNVGAYQNKRLEVGVGGARRFPH